MATTNQRNRSGGQRASQNIQGKAQKTASQAADKLTNMRDDVADYVSQGSDRFGEMTRGHENQAVLIALAAGFGVGFVIGCSLVSSNRRPPSWRERMMAEGFGRKMMDRLDSMLPDAISEHLHR